MSKKEIYLLVGGGCLLSLCVVLLLVGGYYTFIFIEAKPIDTVVTAAPITLPNPNGLTLGDPNAKVTIDVFEDFQCPACQQFSDQIEPLIVQNLVATGKAKYIFRHYPFIDGPGAQDG